MDIFIGLKYFPRIYHSGSLKDEYFYTEDFLGPSLQFPSSFLSCLFISFSDYLIFSYHKYIHSLIYLSQSYLIFPSSIPFSHFLPDTSFTHYHRELVQKQPLKCFTVPTVAMIGIEVLSALEAFHACGFVHRDIKPVWKDTGKGEMKE